MEDFQLLWEKVVALLELKVSAVSFDLWIKPIKPYLASDKKSLLLVANTLSAKSQLVKNHKNQIAETLAEVANEEIQFQILHTKEYEEMKEKEIAEVNNGEVFVAEVKNPFNPKYTFENFVVGKSNQFVYAACHAVAENPGTKFNPLFIYGGVGLGKTHLLHAIGNYLTSNASDKKVQYATCEKFTNDYIDSIRNNRGAINSSFREKYRNVDVLMVDDMQFISNKTSTQEEFFHTFNDLFQMGKQIIISSDRPPKEISTLEDRLRSRFASGLIQDIQSPDFETRVAILRKKAELEKFKLDDDVIDYIAQKVNTNIREMEGILSKVFFFASLLGKKSASMDEAYEAMKEHEDVRKDNITPQTIISAVCDYFEVTKEDITGKKKTKDKVEPRMIAIYLICEILNLPLIAIGKMFGNRDHTTIMYARDKISLENKNNQRISRAIEEIKNKISY
ncbi:MAG: chromosomal replication initiator protein DnaA [Clostridia bacterium]